MKKLDSAFGLLNTPTKIHCLRALVACVMFGIVASFPIFPDFIVPGLLLLLALIVVQIKLWQALSRAVIAENQLRQDVS